MIRYIELTPNPDVTFQSGRITTIVINEGDSVEKGDLLMIVDAQGKEAQVLANQAGKITELIVQVDDVIHKLTCLLILETNISDKPTDAPSDLSSDLQIKQKSEEPQTMPLKAIKTTPKKSKKRAPKKASKKVKKGDAENQASLNFDLLNDQSNNKVQPIKETNNTMSEIKVPDLGGADAVEVIDILVKVGDKVNVDDPLLTVESDKASMDIPAEVTGTITEILTSVGNNVSEGDLILKIDGVEQGSSADSSTEDKNDSKEAMIEKNTPAEPTQSPEPSAAQASQNTELQITIPDLGGAGEVDVIDILVSVGDTIEADQAVITVESDKASMDVPSSNAGVITAISVSVGDKANEGDQILTIQSSAASNTVKKAETITAPATASQPQQTVETITVPSSAPSTATVAQQGQSKPSGPSHASPSVRRLARELGVDLANVAGTARKNRISKDDVKNFVKGILVNGSPSAHSGSAASPSSGAGIQEIPAQDFSKFGEIEVQALNKIKRLTAQHLHRCWLNVPHVTHSDEANIQSLEDFRKTLNQEYAKRKKDIKISPLAFIVKVVVNALQTYPQFNSSLENGGENLIVKKYINIGIAVETPNGLVVPVIRDADKLSVAEIAVAMGELAKKARDGKLTPGDMQGGTFSISSLGGIGGTHFTPIVNAPEVAILGVSRTKIQAEWNGSEFIPAPILPLSLSYDHRVIDGAEAARFTRHIAVGLEDLRRLTV